MITISTNRLLLRPIQLNDAATVFAYKSDATANRFQDWIPETLAEVENKYSGAAITFNQPDMWYQLVMVQRASGKLIGDIGIHILEEGSNAVELGCTLAAKYHRRGYATEAIRSAIDHLHKHYDKKRVIGSVDPRNIASVKLLERLGFVQTDHIKAAFEIRGEVVDDLRFELVLEDH